MELLTYVQQSLAHAFSAVSSCVLLLLTLFARCTHFSFCSGCGWSEDSSASEAGGGDSGGSGGREARHDRRPVYHGVEADDFTRQPTPISP